MDSRTTGSPVAQGLTGRGVLKTHDGDDVARADLGDLLTLVGVHAVDLADALLAALEAVQHLGAGLHDARVDAHVGELAQVRVAHDLEDQAGERLVVARLADELGLLRLVLGVVALDGLDVQGRGEVGDDRVEQGLHALVLERGAAQDRDGRTGDGRATDRGNELLRGGLLALQVQLHDLVVGLGQRLDELFARLAGRVDVALGNVDGVVHLPERGLRVPDVGLHEHQVDDALEVALGTDVELDRHGVRAEALTEHVDTALELGADLVHLVDEADTRNAVAVSLAPDLLRLGLDTFLGVEDRDGTVENTQRTLDLDREVHVAGRVDDVDGVVVPVGGGSSRGNGDTPLLLLLHPVHRGGAVVDLTHLVGDTGVVEDPLSRRGLTRVDVSHDPDVADLGQV